MMDVYDAFRTRRTMRDFAPRAIEFSVLEKLLDAGLRAPMHDPENGRRFLLVQDPATRAELVRGFHRDRTQEEVAAVVDSWNVSDPRQRAMSLDALPKQGSMVLSAAALLIPCFLQASPLLAAKESLHELNAFAEVWACLENILVAAAAEGIFGVTKVPSTPAETDHIRRTLGIPADYEVPCYLALGYPRTEAPCFEPTLGRVRSYVFQDCWGHAPQ